MKKASMYVLSFGIHLLFFNLVFADSTEKFQIQNIQFIPFSDNNRNEVSAIMSDPDCCQPPYEAWTDQNVLKSYIDRHIDRNFKTNLGAWVVKIDNTSVGVVSFAANTLFPNPENIKKDSSVPTDKCGGKKDGGVTIRMSNLRLQSQFHRFFPTIINAMISHAFEKDASLQYIGFAIQKTSALGQQYAQEKKLEIMEYCLLETTGTMLYMYKISREFYIKNKKFFEN